MKSILRHFIITIAALWVTSKIMPGLSIEGGASGLLIAGAGFLLANIILVPLVRILLLPLNLLTLGIFAWLSNVFALYILVRFIPSIKLFPYYFPGGNFGGFIVPAIDMSTFQVAIVASLIIGGIIHFIQWLEK